MQSGEFDLPVRLSSNSSNLIAGAPNVSTQPPAGDSPSSHPQRQDCPVAQAPGRRQNRCRQKSHYRQVAQTRDYVSGAAADKVKPLTTDADLQSAAGSGAG